MGPKVRYLGPEVPEEDLIWQDPIPAVDHDLVEPRRHREPQGQNYGYRPDRLPTGINRLGQRFDFPAARICAAARTVRESDCCRKRTGRLTSPNSWPKCSRPWRPSKKTSTSHRRASKRVSLADLIILGGCVGIEQSAQKAGKKIQVPFAPGRMDASQEQTDVSAFAVLEPVADGFRNYLKRQFTIPAEKLLVDRAQLLNLSAPEMTVLIGGMRMLGAHVGNTRHGVFTDRPETLSNDFFVNLLDMNTVWVPTDPGRRPFTKARTGRPASPNGPAPGSTSSSDRILNCAPSPKSTRLAMPRTNSYQILSRHGIR